MTAMRVTAHLTNDALADRLRILIEQPRAVAADDRRAWLQEAKHRLEQQPDARDVVSFEEDDNGYVVNLWAVNGVEYEVRRVREAAQAQQLTERIRELLRSWNFVR